MSRRKSAAITDRKLTNWPMVIRVSDLFHITHEECKRGKDNAYLTLCGHALTFSLSVDDLPQPGDSRRLCARCGTREAFAETMAQHRANMAERSRRWHEESEGKHAAAQQAAEKYLAPMKAVLESWGMAIQSAGPWKITLNVGGNLFDVTAHRDH